MNKIGRTYIDITMPKGGEKRAPGLMEAVEIVQCINLPVQIHSFILSSSSLLLFNA